MWPRLCSGALEIFLKLSPPSAAAFDAALVSTLAEALDERDGMDVGGDGVGGRCLGRLPYMEEAYFADGVGTGFREVRPSMLAMDGEAGGLGVNAALWSCKH